MPSSEIVIHADRLSKRYRVTEQKARYRTLRSSLSDALASPFRRGRQGAAKRRSRAEPDTMWALEDVSFDIRRGDVVGVVGRNGAGKSTLLKLLSRITEPTAGHAEIRGRVGSLLEVGTGFHNELTGRENIFLNGAILGMRKAEIVSKFDEIVAFAEVERFVDTPVKHYSTGMYLRLAFAVAAHLEPEILLVDEVLAVGDVAFQSKCLGKMDRVARQGRTVLFVSHNMSAVRSLCHTGLVLDHGKVAVFGDVSGAIEAYYRMVGALRTETEAAPERGFGPVTINGGSGAVNSSEGFRAATTFNVPEDASAFSIYCTLSDMHGRQVFSLTEGVGSVTPGIYAVDVTVPPLWLVSGLYSLHFKVLFSGSFASARHVSDHVPVDIVGQANKTNALLAPAATWCVRRNGAAQ